MRDAAKALTQDVSIVEHCFAFADWVRLAILLGALLEHRAQIQHIVMFECGNTRVFVATPHARRVFLMKAKAMSTRHSLQPESAIWYMEPDVLPSASSFELVQAQELFHGTSERVSISGVRVSLWPQPSAG